MADVLDRKALAKVIRDIDRAKARIAKERDKLDGLISEAEAIVSDSHEACDDLQRARDALSRYL